MSLKVFKIKKYDEDAILSVGKKTPLIMTKKPSENVFLITHNLRKGLICTDKLPIALIEIGNKNNKYFFKDISSHKIYSSSPLGSRIGTAFVADRDEIKARELFDIEPTVESIGLAASFLEFSAKYLASHDDNKYINLSWFRKENGGVNFGDEINPHIVAFLSKKKIRRVEFKNTDLIAVGSILHKAPKRKKPYKVWGTGTLSPEYFDSSRFDFRALRGPLTRSLLDIHQPIVYGDPGIIVDRVWPAAEKKKFKWGIIPHMTQENKPWVKKLVANTPGAVLIRTSEKDLAQMMHKISSCEVIASTSLHGLIVADSYNIPSVWLWENNVNRGGQWKFFDYFAGAHRSYVDNVDPREIDNLDQIKLPDRHFSYFNNLSSVKNEIMDAFPL